MYRRAARLFGKWIKPGFVWLTLISFSLASSSTALAMNSARGGALPQPLPLFPADNWWNLDISNWPVDSNSSSYISFVNNGGTRRLHPDFGGNAGSGFAIYGFPYAVVTNVVSTDLKTVQFQYADESDGVNHSTNTSVPFYPLPSEAITQPYWVEGGDPANVDERSSADRHLLVVDRDRNYLYELYNVFYDATQAKWFAGSGAFFDMNTNNRRPDTWTSADAAGLAILPGLVRYDEFSDPTTTEIKHALRVTVRATNGYVYPASHRAGSTSGALPLGARLRLKSSVDVSQKSSDPNVQKIFRAMQKYGLIVADNGSDMYISGTYDTRWNNDILNPAFGNLSASDFEVIQLGYNPTVGAANLSSLSVSPSTVTGGQTTSGTVILTSPAAAGGAVVTLSSANPAATVPSSVTVPVNATSIGFSINTAAVTATAIGNISASYNGVAKSASLTVKPVAAAALSTLTLYPTTVRGGVAVKGTVTLTASAPAGGFDVSLSSSSPSKAVVPASVKVPAGSSTANFNINTTSVNKKTLVTITASAGGSSRNSQLTIVRR